MRQYLLPEAGQFFKVNLHAHTVCSDGRLTPEEVKARFKETGYSAVVRRVGRFPALDGRESD